MDSDAEKWEAIEDSSNVVRNSFLFFASLFVNGIPDILLRLPLLAFFPHFEYLWTRNILGSVGVPPGTLCWEDFRGRSWVPQERK